MSPQAAARLDALRSAQPNSWIALSEDETKIVAVGATYAEVSHLSDRAGVEAPVIVRIPARWVPLSVWES